MKYNEKVSDYNSENQKSKAFQRIGNLVFNKEGSRDDQSAWLGIKEYIKRLEEKVRRASFRLTKQGNGSSR